MTPGARVAAAIEVLHDMSEGLAAEQALTRWARRSRFAGSKDRAAIRDHVFDVLRCKRTAAHFGKGETPRALLIGILRQQGADLEALFSGIGHAPQPLSAPELEEPTPPEDTATLWNLPDWVIPSFQTSLGEAAGPTALALQERAPVFLRVNLAKTTRSAAMSQLAEEGIATQENAACATALTVTEGARKIRNSAAYAEGLVELQDAASQAVVSALPSGAKLLDYCAGGGGKALAAAAQNGRAVWAHDIDSRRMADLTARAERAGVQVGQLDTEALQGSAPFDVVLCDAPCSGSGAWRRAAEGKWTLTATRLAELTEIQDKILDDAAGLVGENGTLAYATCSVLTAENEDRLAAFLERHAGWRCTYQQRFAVGPTGDGFFAAHFIRA
ncbi:RsmB/NOP family class I SAM-dependent RNA methyltransferase [Sulfitobacter sp. M57]|uniref:RsmB/NOP family class I SAM-dependent RNA methyltransferase n=1 Tax=Sulfitobacter sp. KE42 TaxID=2731155 RepID=UPI0023E187D4|nr:MULTISPECIES: RsmB/NOP family class I SAM-dependent RNA methyltransferase [unclassified Sulfitobacter]MDF3413853.1 RsmB/NOP family class I SAM-dependent RNA methyltransferase [Sulfitobacter sp. KE5]MDF3420866.1 RsmB/NOP family class I SAM-dependent RNA methyltransferase [Sulfitobacter sp. KE43]MDF3432399.1 RsmB/NOP family class I SAM-dependent RNA methyltransferase [Sulfitobacter sp. KE42]MDF3458038.1 RsmB/NOP family class I SAM-dependent RNA methyltransferase [Sulfitobacter sp. S74]MDF3461